MKKILPSLILLALLLGSVYFAQRYFNQPDIPELYSIPDFEFLSHQGTVFSNQNFSNKISVASFIFTNCPGICPVMSREMFVLYDEFSSSDEIQFISFSVDPARDSLQALKDYAENWGVEDERWHFLKTENETIQTLYEQGFKLGGDLPYSHSTKFVLIDNNNLIRGYYNFDEEEDMKLLRDHISALSADI